MIVRLWRGTVPADKMAACLEYTRETGVRDYLRNAGNAGVYVLGRQLGDAHEIATLSLWDSLQAIRAFAGDEPTRARYYPRDLEFLIDPPRDAEHFDVLVHERASGR